MLDLHRPHGTIPARDVRRYVEGLEEWMIRTLARFGVRGERRPGRIGIWVANTPRGEAKIGAIGVRVTRWVSWHGVALNVAMDLAPFSRIDPCGYAGLPTVDMSTLGVSITWRAAADRLAARLQQHLSP
jgi:lipoyl(octanoyl) transferase